MRLSLQPGQMRVWQSRDSLKRRKLFYSTADGKRSYSFFTALQTLPNVTLTQEIHVMSAADFANQH